MFPVQQTGASKVSLLKIPSGDDFLAGRMYIAEGEERNATVLLLHGFPGTILNLDIATQLQAKGWNVLVINYRGSWGSTGNYSFANAIEDVQATLRFIKKPEIAKENRIDVERIGVVGHSFGGFLALITASVDPTIQVVASLSGANFSLFVEMIEQNPELEPQILNMLGEASFFLKEATGEKLLQEIYEHEKEWDTFLFAPTLTIRNLLITAVTQDAELPKEYFHDPLVQILETTGIQFDSQIFETDHNYTDKRIELSNLLEEWLLKHL
ncbi:MAG TPA: alpha/beta fold hydrolase [Ureibacillus sp.]|nr:alpha/beta fold hydrolase [Ureibacillus sp.]